MAYYTLLSRNDDNQWVIEFGDYSKENVQSELNDYRDQGYKKKNLKIISTGTTQNAINEAVAKLNGAA